MANLWNRAQKHRQARLVREARRWVGHDGGNASSGGASPAEDDSPDTADVEAQRAMERAWRAFDTADRDLAIARMREEALKLAPSHRTGVWRWPAMGAMAAAVAGAAVALLWTGDRIGSPAPDTQVVVYRTAVGEQRVLDLADGSRVTLDTGSFIDVSLGRERRVRLYEGQALFEVRSDPRAPFVVEAGGYRTVAVGTTFEVRLEDGSLEVTLAEGRVQVDRGGPGASGNDGAPDLPVMLQPGQKLRVSTHVPRPEIASVPVETELLWHKSFVEFDDERLDRAVAELNRYTDRPVVIGDPEVAALRISGVFRTHQMQRFLDVVAVALPVELRPRPDQSVEIVGRSGNGDLKH